MVYPQMSYPQNIKNKKTTRRRDLSGRKIFFTDQEGWFLV